MKSLSPMMEAVLQRISRGEKAYGPKSIYCYPWSTLQALQKRGLVLVLETRVVQLTDAGRQVVAELEAAERQAIADAQHAENMRQVEQGMGMIPALQEAHRRHFG